MDDKQLTRLLHDIAQEVPDDMNLWPHIQAATHRTSRWAGLIPKTRIGWVAAVIGALLMVGAGAYAVEQLLQISDPGLEAANTANLVVHFNETQTIGDVSVTLEYAYADANRLAIAYHGTASVPANTATSVGFTQVSLSDDQGREYDQILFGGGGGGGGGDANSEYVTVSFGLVDNYATSMITDAPEALNLRLELMVGDMGSGMMPSGDGAGDVPTPEVTVEPFTPVGPFIFEFTIPFNPGLVMDGPQTVTAADIPMTLNRVVVTPSLTRLELCFVQPPIDSTAPYWVPVVSLTINGEEAVPATEIGRDAMAADTDSGCVHYNIPVALHDQPGEWVLNVEKLLLPGGASQEQMREALMERGIEIVDEPSGGWSYVTPPDMSHSELGVIIQEINAQYQRTIEGPWTFTFTLR